MRGADLMTWLLCAASALVVSGCSGDDNSGASGSATDSITDSATDTGPNSTSQDPTTTTNNSTTSGTTGTTESMSTGPESTTDAADCLALDEATESPDVGRVLCCRSVAADFPSISTTLVAVTVTIDGDTPVGGEYDSGLLFLEEVTTGDRALLGSTADKAFDVRVFPGRYRVVYEVDRAQEKAPINTRAVVLESVTIASHMDSLAIDVKTVELSGALLVDGVPPVKSSYDAAEIELYDAATDSRTVILDTAKTHMVSARVIPGEYELRYAVTDIGTEMPRNGDAALKAVTVDEGPTFSLGDIAVATVALDAGVTIDGEAPPPSELDNAEIYLVDRDTGDRIFVGETMNGKLGPARVIGGPARRYDLRYAALKSQSLPINEWSLLAADVDAGSMPASIDLPTALVSGSVEIDGGPAPQGEPEESALISLERSDDRAILGATKDGPFQRRVLALSSYDVIYGHEASSGVVPANNQARIVEDYAAGDALALNVETTLLSGTIKVGGAPPPASVYDNGRLFLRSADGDVVALGETRFGGFERRVVNKVYDVVYSVDTAGGMVPSNVDYVVEQLDLTTEPVAEKSVDIDVPAESFTIKLNFDNPAEAVERGRILVRLEGTEELLYVGEITEGMTAHLSGTLVPGTYGIFFQADRGGFGIPANQGAMISCMTFDG
ncbi:MAG: hypothetical protein KC486_01395 [Myxococcales bacterium]|nr:hypothetical protein [Myxococcales bacterium]